MCIVATFLHICGCHLEEEFILARHELATRLTISDTVATIIYCLLSSQLKPFLMRPVDEVMEAQSFGCEEKVGSGHLKLNIAVGV